MSAQKAAREIQAAQAELAKLEDQMTTWDATGSAPSPDRMDARVWLLTILLVDKPATEGRVHSAPPQRQSFARR